MSSLNKEAADATEKEVLRGPGRLESMSTFRHSLGYYTAVCCTARFTRLSTTSPISFPQLLYAALHEVIAQHPPLAISIKDELSASARFVRLSSIDLDRIIHLESLPAGSDEVAQQRLMNELIEKRLSTRFSNLGDLPLWRLVGILPHSGEDADTQVDVALFIHHGIADGGSAVMFMQSLLTALNAASALQRGEHPGQIVSPPKVTFLPPLEMLHPLPVSFVSLVRAIWDMWFPPSRAGLWAGGPINCPSTSALQDTSSPVLQARHAIRVFPAETAISLLAACRAHKTTLTPLLQALVARALFASLPTDGSANLLRSSCPINLRPFMPEQKTTMGVFVASTEFEFKRKNADVWKQAKRVGKSLTRVLTDMKKGKHFNVGMLRYIGDVRKLFEGKDGKARGYSFEVSNTGAVDGSGEGPWRISQLMFSQSGSITGEALTFSVSSIRGGPMTVAASWVEGVVDEAFVDATLEKLESSVGDVCSGKL
ncbi:hypothetical protein PENSPDRAFT_647999 [Peniophora sp. CONT]|nr:hypothetical protein PENSPDRAFT_647999 [Peniophora sp. CONT]